MYACGVTIAGLMKRKKKNPPISELMEASDASGYFRYCQVELQPLLTLVRLLICLQIHRIPYGTDSMLSMIVVKKLLAISINMANLGWMIAWTSALDAASSGATPRGSDGGSVPVSSSICWIICSYT